MESDKSNECPLHDASTAARRTEGLRPLRDPATGHLDEDDDTEE
ncbi:hypothetical protein ABZ890_43880 [Streptomyces sp. NPDC046984]